jgi:hypothetical protein
MEELELHGGASRASAHDVGSINICDFFYRGARGGGEALDFSSESVCPFEVGRTKEIPFGGSVHVHLDNMHPNYRRAVIILWKGRGYRRSATGP